MSALKYSKKLWKIFINTQNNKKKTILKHEIHLRIIIINILHSYLSYKLLSLKNHYHYQKKKILVSSIVY